MPDTPDGTTDPVTAFLSDVRAQAEDHHLVPASQVLPLVAAAEAVLKRHACSGEPVKTHSLCRDHSALAHHSGRMPREVIEICPECTVTEKYVCVTCRAECPDDDGWPCAEYRTITRALAGEEAGDGQP